MTLSPHMLKQTCERQLARLRAGELGRHELLDVVTTLLLLTDSLTSQVDGDVSGHQQVSSACPWVGSLARIREDLEWVQAYGHSEPVHDIRRRTESAAHGLMCYLETGVSGESTP